MSAMDLRYTDFPDMVGPVTMVTRPRSTETKGQRMTIAVTFYVHYRLSSPKALHMVSNLLRHFKQTDTRVCKGRWCDRIEVKLPSGNFGPVRTY